MPGNDTVTAADMVEQSLEDDDLLESGWRSSLYKNTRTTVRRLRPGLPANSTEVVIRRALSGARGPLPPPKPTP